MYEMHFYEMLQTLLKKIAKGIAKRFQLSPPPSPEVPTYYYLQYPRVPEYEI